MHKIMFKDFLREGDFNFDLLQTRRYFLTFFLSIFIISNDLLKSQHIENQAYYAVTLQPNSTI